MQKSQSLLEYATIIAVVAAALMAMHVYVQRATQSNLRLVEDRMTARSGKPPVYTPVCKPNPCNTYKDCIAVSGNCASGYSCLGACTIPVIAPVCKPNPCSTYKDCTAVSGDCSSGHPCSGTCDPIAPIIPPGAEEWDWNTFPYFVLYAGQTKTYLVDIPAGIPYLVAWAFGLSIETNGTFTWQYPDGQIFNSTRTSPILGVNIAGFLKLDSPPPGKHIFTVIAITDSYLTLKVDR